MFCVGFANCHHRSVYMVLMFVGLQILILSCVGLQIRRIGEICPTDISFIFFIMP